MKTRIIVFLGIFAHNCIQAINAWALSARDKAVDDLLAQVNRMYDAPVSNAVNSAMPVNGDLRWFFAVLLIGAYILWFRPTEWKNLIDRLVNTRTAEPSTGREHRKWWRHDLLPLNDKNICIKLEPEKAKASTRLIPLDIGYGGMSFECDRLRKLQGKLNFSILTPASMSPVRVEGNIAWQKNSWNVLRRRVGVSFINPPEKEWAGIHHYIEKQYAALKQ
ncbi:MAG: PilZ domain-containing protein [Candidatus Omnitrophota bacterium]|jgi:hypothetical protein